MTTPHPEQSALLFLSYSRNDPDAAMLLRRALTQHGVEVFKDDLSIREGDQWLERLSAAVSGCGSFVVLVGRDGVQRWIGAETQVALLRHFDERDEAKRLPIYPILLNDTRPESLPAFLRLFQATRWDGASALPERLLEQIRSRSPLVNTEHFDRNPYVGLDAYRADQAQLFFGRQKETLEALACFDVRAGKRAIRWLEINGNSGSGKSSLMNAGLLPLVDQGWLWPRTKYSRWRRIGPLMPGEHPMLMLAEHLARSFKEEMSSVRQQLEGSDPRALADWLRTRKNKEDEEDAFLLAIDQFEELFTLANSAGRARFDELLATALNDPPCHLFVISTVRADFLDRFERLPYLLAARNRLGHPWTLPPIRDDGLREIIAGPARLAGGVSVSEVQELIVKEARDEPGALPLVENALYWLWEQKGSGTSLSGRLYSDQGGLAGILKQGADHLLESLGGQKHNALELLLRLVRIDPEQRLHTRRRIALDEAVAAAGGGERGRALLNRLAGAREPGTDNKTHSPLRLITIAGGDTNGKQSRVNLIHETLIRGKGLDAKGDAQPYWPMLWQHIEENKDNEIRFERFCAAASEWEERGRDARLLLREPRLSEAAKWQSTHSDRLTETHRLFYQESVDLRDKERQAEQRRRHKLKALVTSVVVILVLVGESVYWTNKHKLPIEALKTRWAYKLGAKLALPKPVKIPAGQFRMGSDEDASERPVHLVSIAHAFYLAETELTFDQYDAFARATARKLPNDPGWGRGSQPVIDVDWNDARAYAKWLSAMTGNACRLPSEAEWEYAARAGTTTKYSVPRETQGSDDIRTEDKGKALANCRDCGSQWTGKQTAPVAQFPANAWGLRDMHGNVWEWVEDCYHESYEGAPVDGRAWTDGGSCTARVVRGGSWLSGAANARSSARFGNYPGNRLDDLGFRVLCASPIE